MWQWVEVNFKQGSKSYPCASFHCLSTFWKGLMWKNKLVLVSSFNCSIYAVKKSNFISISRIRSSDYLISWSYNTKQEQQPRVFIFENLLKSASLWSHPRLGNLNETQIFSSPGFFLKILNSVFESINMGLDFFNYFKSFIKINEKMFLFGLKSSFRFQDI